MLDKSQFDSSDVVLGEFLELLQPMPEKNFSFSVTKDIYDTYFDYKEEISSDKEIAIFDYFQGKSEGLNVNQHSITSYKKAEYLIYPREFHYKKKFRTKFSIVFIDGKYCFSKHWEKYITYIAHKKLRPVSFYSYYIKPTVNITESMLDYLLLLFNSSDKNNKEMFKTMMLTINFDTKDPFEILLLKCLRISLKDDSASNIFYSSDYSSEINDMVIKYLDKSFMDKYKQYGMVNDIIQTYPVYFNKYIKPIVLDKLNYITSLYFTGLIKVKNIEI
jgi:hypothetical protein